MVRNTFFAILFAFFCAFTYAGQTAIDTSGLSDSQIAELKAQAAQAVANQAKAATGVSVKDAGDVIGLAATWGQQASIAAEGFARAFSIAARELGVTVNDFLHTDAGKLTAALIVWKVAGAAIMHMLYVAVMMMVGLFMLRRLYLHTFTDRYKEVTVTRLFGLYTTTKMIRVPKAVSQLNTDGEWLCVWIMIIGTILLALVGILAF